MENGKWMLKSLGTLVVLMLMLIAAGCRGEKAVVKEKPNFVWIISEDNSKHYMDLFDPNGIATPEIAALAEEGIRFNRAFSNGPVCSVARSTLISACYGPRTGAQFHRKSQMVPMPDGVEMFPAYLRMAGYYTTNRQKEDYNYIKSDSVWDESSGKAHWRNRAEGQPFFHKASYPDSHESRLHFPAGLMERYRPVTDPDSVHLFPNHPDTELFRFTAAYYRDKILAIDSIVGRVVDELEADGLLESTFIFYFGDHGGVLPGSKGYIWETGLHVPLVVRVPERYRHLVDFEPGASTDGFVSFTDLGPTLLQLAGLDLPGGIDGQPVMGGDLKAADLAARDVTFGYADRFDEKYDLVRTVRKGQMKYMRSYQPFNFDGLQNNYRYKCLAFTEWRDMYLAGELNGEQAQFFEPRAPEALYDLDADPYELNNLAADPAYASQLHELRILLNDWVRDMPDLSFIPEPVLRREAFDNPVDWGRAHRDEIVALADLADLALLPFEEAREGISAALRSDDPLQRYWGLIVCACFGESAAEFNPLAETLCGDNDLLVRTRAAEFLGLQGKGDPEAVICGALYESRDGVEGTLIMNSLVLLMDGPQGCDFRIDPDMLDVAVREDAEASRRIEYILSRMEAGKKP